MISRNFFFFRTDALTFPLRSGNYFVDRFFEVFHFNRFLTVPGGQNCGLIDKIGKVGAAKTGRLFSQRLQIRRSSQGFVPGVHF